MSNKFITPCYVFDRDDFENNVSLFKTALQNSFGDNWILGYSFKTNYLPYLLNSAKEFGCYAEVVSDKEYKLAREIGFESGEIIYNGPVKGKESFLEAIQNGCIVNIDSKRELKWLEELPKEKQFQVGVRAYFDLEKELPGETLMGDEGGRFGFCDANGELASAINRIEGLGNVKVKYLHLHTSSKSKSVEIYRHLVQHACEVIDRECIDIDYIDIGGGFFGGGDDGSSYANYVRVIKETLMVNAKENIGIVVEPGASLVATSFSYIVQVIDEKMIDRNRIVVTDGSRLHIDPFFVRSKYAYKLISDSTIKENVQTIVGFTCMEKDRIMKIENEICLSEGNRIVFNTVGSYTMCLNSDFISSEPRVYAISKGKEYLVRKEKDISSYFLNSVVEEIE